MRSSWIWIVLLLALAAVGWMVFGGGAGGSSSRDDLPDIIDADDENGLKGADDTAPELKGSSGGSADRPFVPSEIRGRGMIQGIARRGGEPVPASVELRHVQEIDPRDPFKGGMETQFIARLLDAGMSAKDVIARVQAGADGVYKFRGLATGLYELRATAEDGAVGFASAALPAKGARVEASVDIPEGDHTLEGLVVYADGTPFRGLVLAAAGGNSFAVMMGGGAKSQPTQTDGEGRFKLPGLAPGAYQISALIPGVMRVMGAPIQVPFTGEFKMTINATGVQVKGKVIDAETEAVISGAKIFGGGGNPSSNFMISSTVSDANGEFTVTLPQGRGGGMFVRADGYAGQAVDLQAGTAGEALTITLLRLAKISGRVTAQVGGAPVEGITVFAMGSERRGLMPSPGTAITDGDGRYTIEGVDPGAVKVHAIGAGYASVGMSGAAFGQTNTPYSLELEPGSEGTLDLEAIASGAVAGRVLTEDGTPVPGAVVEAAGGGSPSGMAAVFLGLGSGWGTAVTDADGAYSINVLVPGTEYTVVAKAPDHPDASSATFQAEGGKTETVDLRMKAPRWLAVRVVDQKGGKPIAGATIMAVGSGPQAMTAQMFGSGSQWKTDAEGNAKIGPLADAALAFHVTAPGYVSNKDTKVEAEHTKSITVELKQGLILAGRIQMPDGIPPQSVRVTVNKQDNSNGWYHENPAIQQDGTWRLDNIEDSGEYKISGRGQYKDLVLKGEVRADTGDENVLLVMAADTSEKSAMLEIAVLDHDGKPVPAGRIQVWSFVGDSGVNTQRGRLSAGRAMVRGVDATGELWVEVCELVGSKRGATIQGPISVAKGKAEVRLGRPMSVSGSVSGEDGKPVAGVRVTATAVHPRPGTSRSGREHGTAVSDTEGRFEVRGLGNLEYSLAFTAPADFVPPKAQTVRAGASGITVSVRTGIRATITVLDAQGKPVVGAWVMVQAGGERPGRTFSRNQSMTGSDGTLTLRGLTPGATFTLRVNPPDGGKTLKSFVSKKWSPADETITLKQAFQIHGTVVDQDGKPAPGITIRHRKVGTENWTGWDRASKDGTFTVTDLEAGAYELKPQGQMRTIATPRAPGQAPPPDPAIVKARAGATGVKIKVDLGQRLTVTIRGGQSSGGGRRSAVMLSADRRSHLQGTWIDRKTVQFQGLIEGTPYGLWVTGLDDGKFVLVERVDGVGGKLSVDAEAGGVIEGTVKVPPGVQFEYVWVTAHNERGMSLNAQADRKTGVFRLEGLPHGGTWSVNANGRTADRKQYSGRASGATGASLSIDLKLLETKR